MNKKIWALSLSLAAVSSVGCNLTGGNTTGSPYVAKGNSPPIIQALTANPQKIAKDTEVKIKVSAFDGDGDTLSYKWSCSKGTMVKSTGDEVSWKPMKDGKIDSGIGIIIAEISDGKSKVAGSVNILINSDGTGNVDVSTEIINLDCQQPVGKNVDVLVKDDLLAPVKDKITVVPDNSIKIDGLIDGWAGIFPVCIDQARDTGQPNDNAHDIKNFYLAKDSKYLYYRIDTWNTPDPAHGTSYRITVGSTGLITKDSTPDNVEFVMKDVSEGKIDLSKLGDINNQYICGVFKQKDGVIRDRTRLIQIVDGKPATAVTTPASVSASVSSTGTETYLLKLASIAGVSDNPPNKSIMTLSSPARITKMFTYHWNGGAGDTPGTIALKNTATGEIFGPWNAVGLKAGFDVALGAAWSTTPDPPYQYWTVQPNVVLPAGDYEVVDSKPATWSYTSDVGNRGIVWIYGWTGGSSPAATSSPSVSGASASLVYYGVDKDVVPASTGLEADRDYDGHFKFTINVASANKTITQMDLYRKSDTSNHWTTDPASTGFTLGVIDDTGTRVNGVVKSVSIPITSWHIFDIYAGDSDPSHPLFAPGLTFVATATFSDGSTVSAEGVTK